MFVNFWQGLALGFPAAALPGSLQAYFLAQTLAQGWRRVLPGALAPLLSDGPIIALVLLVLTQLPGWGLAAVQFSGGLFLLYLARGAWGVLGRPAAQPSAVAAAAAAPTAVGRSPLRIVLQAALINLLNPNPYLFWSTVGGVRLLTAWRVDPAHALGFLLGMYVALCGGFALSIALFGALGAVPDPSRRFGRALALLATAALLGFGLWQIGSAVVNLWDIVG